MVAHRGQTSLRYRNDKDALVALQTQRQRLVAATPKLLDMKTSSVDAFDIAMKLVGDAFDDSKACLVRSFMCRTRIYLFCEGPMKLLSRFASSSWFMIPQCWRPHIFHFVLTFVFPRFCFRQRGHGKPHGTPLLMRRAARGSCTCWARR